MSANKSNNSEEDEDRTLKKLVKTKRETVTNTNTTADKTAVKRRFSWKKSKKI